MEDWGVIHTFAIGHDDVFGDKLELKRRDAHRIVRVEYRRRRFHPISQMLSSASTRPGYLHSKIQECSRLYDTDSPE